MNKPYRDKIHQMKIMIQEYNFYKVENILKGIRKKKNKKWLS